MLAMAVDRRRCAACLRWSGQRQTAEQPGSVLVEAETAVGLCLGGPWNNSERRARSACGHWTIWPALLPADGGNG